jgi:subtilisin family serine protease
MRPLATPSPASSTAASAPPAGSPARVHTARTVATIVVLVALAAVTGARTPPARAAGDPALADQWGLSLVGAPEAWRTATGSGTTIAVVDSGIDLAHEDLAEKIVEPRSWVSATAQDDAGHGSHVAGIAGAVTGNGKGVAGVAPGARLMPLKVLARDPLDGRSKGSFANVVAAIRHAADHGAAPRSHW